MGSVIMERSRRRSGEKEWGEGKGEGDWGE
jgi:hypothetical protein